MEKGEEGEGNERGDAPCQDIPVLDSSGRSQPFLTLLQTSSNHPAFSASILKGHQIFHFLFCPFPGFTSVVKS